MPKKIIAFFSLALAASLTFAAEPSFSLVETVPSNVNYVKTDAARTETVWLDMVQAAQHSIAIGSFFFASAPRTSMEKFLQALLAAADRQVQIRILIDRSMQQLSDKTIGQLQHENISVRYINYKVLSGGVMHAKYMIIDATDSFVGSQNFGWKAMSQNHEVGIRIKSASLASTLLRVFDLDWQLSDMKTPRFEPQNRKEHANLNDAVIYPAFSPKKGLAIDLYWELPQLLQLIESAKQQILIQVYQYSDLSGRQLRNHWLTLDKALIAATKRGVKVKVLVSDAMLNNKAGLRGLGGISNVTNLEIKISSIPVFKGKNGPYTRVDHAKFMVIDEQISWIGTGNWQKNYFYNSRDIAIIIRDPTINAQLQQSFFSVWNSRYARFTI